MSVSLSDQEQVKLPTADCICLAPHFVHGVTEVKRRRTISPAQDSDIHSCMESRQMGFGALRTRH